MALPAIGPKPETGASSDGVTSLTTYYIVTEGGGEAVGPERFAEPRSSFVSQVNAR
jgi:hypothetical protein